MSLVSYSLGAECLGELNLMIYYCCKSMLNEYKSWPHLTSCLPYVQIMISLGRKYTSNFQHLLSNNTFPCCLKYLQQGRCIWHSSLTVQSRAAPSSIGMIRVEALVSAVRCVMMSWRLMGSRGRLRRKRLEEAVPKQCIDYREDPKLAAARSARSVGRLVRIEWSWVTLDHSARIVEFLGRNGADTSAIMNGANLT